MEDTYKISDVEFLISTQNQFSLNFLNEIFKDIDVTTTLILIINQTQKGNDLISDFTNIRVINSYETGVAKSRNLALDNARGKIVVFADDDVTYFENTTRIIVDAYNFNNDPDGILFQAQKSSSQLLKKYAKKLEDPISTFSILNCGTIEVTLNRKNIDSDVFKFDERFGINGLFELGDEPLFLMDLKRNNRRLIFVNKTIVQHESITTISKNSKQKNYFALGAFYKQIFPRYHRLWIFVKLFFDLKQKKIKVREVHELLSCAKEGRKKLKLTTTKKEI